MDDFATEWTSKGDGAWTRALQVAAGEPPLLLRVSPSDLTDRGDDPWLWEVVEAGSEGDPEEGQIDAGSMATRTAAMEAALDRARAHIAILAEA
ncbi:hypothetical protein [Roseomonas chloroacetimidivorans]|uniref:hypothetical protein n=1 Tax=Roseomonas chloroacetimidivorans TaxID=1766656 RepID=UPI003C784FA9